MGDERVRALEPRSMAPCVARDRWHRAWPARDSEVFSDDLPGKNRYKRCRRESHSSGVSPVRRFPVSVCLSVVRGPRSMAPCVARRSNVAVRGLCGAIDRSVRGAIAVSDRSNVALRGLCSDFCQNSSEPRCGRSLRPIVFSTLVSYRAGRCLRT